MLENIFRNAQFILSAMLTLGVRRFERSTCQVYDILIDQCMIHECSLLMLPKKKIYMIPWLEERMWSEAKEEENLPTKEEGKAKSCCYSTCGRKCTDKVNWTNDSGHQTCVSSPPILIYTWKRLNNFLTYKLYNAIKLATKLVHVIVYIVYSSR